MRAAQVLPENPQEHRFHGEPVGRVVVKCRRDTKLRFAYIVSQIDILGHSIKLYYAAGLAEERISASHRRGASRGVW
jgi:hypothetical protein